MENILIWDFWYDKARIPKSCHTETCVMKALWHFNLPTAFWGLLGPQKDVKGNFTKTVSKQMAIFPIIVISLAWSKIASGVLKDPKRKNVFVFD